MRISNIWRPKTNMMTTETTMRREKKSWMMSLQRKKRKNSKKRNKCPKFLWRKENLLCNRRQLKELRVKNLQRSLKQPNRREGARSELIIISEHSHVVKVEIRLPVFQLRSIQHSRRSDFKFLVIKKWLKLLHLHLCLENSNYIREHEAVNACI